MGQYIEKSNIIIRWLLIAANFITLVKSQSGGMLQNKPNYISGSVLISGFCRYLDNRIQIIYIRSADRQTVPFVRLAPGTVSLLGIKTGCISFDTTLAANKTIRKRRDECDCNVTIHYLRLLVLSVKPICGNKLSQFLIRML